MSSQGVRHEQLVDEHDEVQVTTAAGDGKPASLQREPSIFIKNYEHTGKRGVANMFLIRKVQKDGQYSFHVHFLPEGLRLVAYLAFGVVMCGGALLYELTKSSLTPMQDTYIYKTFGFAHSCVLIDEGPPKTYATMMLPLWEYPMVFYLLTSTQRAYDDYKEGKRNVSYGVMLFAVLVLPFNVLSTIMFRQVFVFGPGSNGETFPAHYGFYIWFQLALFLDIVKNVTYLDCLKLLPFKNNRPSAYIYLVLLGIITFVYIIFGVSATAGNPVFSWTSNSGAIEFVHALSVLYFILAVPVQIFLSWYEVVYGDNRYVTFAMS
eukprot:TRINITY_DN1194_c0_g1_i2.p1 TRINITY_DN1194_c0_g1~~TRINITY_DN1194_c0_g1_i2.p1  ORF type:complete len:336 (-),score=88.10 TRINITY_DN1194_c0_g1_i2:151-1110(-)